MFAAAQSTKQLQRATLTLSVDALMSARVTKTHAEFMQLQASSMQQCLMALVTRNFTSPQFELCKFVESMAGVPSKADLTSGFGEANQCHMNADLGKTHRSVEDDRRIYPWFQLALIYVVVADVPTLDFGFGTALMWFADNVTLFTAMHTPLSWVARIVCRTFAHAHRLRVQALEYDSVGEDPYLQYSDSASITASKGELMEWCSNDHSTRQIQWDRCSAMSVTPTTPAPKSASHSKAASTAVEGRKTAVPKVEPRAKSDTHHSLLDQQKWRTAYGTTTVDGKSTQICWFHANRPGGCNSKRSCKYDHNAYPKAYHSKHFEHLPVAEQRTILAACKKETA
jgi:hypothetical protein